MNVTTNNIIPSISLIDPFASFISALVGIISDFFKKRGIKE